MKRLILTILLTITNWCFADCNFTKGDTLILSWQARPDSEQVTEYIIYRTYDGSMNYWTTGTPDTVYEFYGLEQTTTFRVSAKNPIEGEMSDPVTAFYCYEEPPPLSDIPYIRTGKELWNEINTWIRKGAVYWHRMSDSTITTVFWTNQTISSKDSTSISKSLSFPETRDYIFKLILSGWSGYEAGIAIDELNYYLSIDTTAKKIYTLNIPIEAGLRIIKITCYNAPMYLWELQILDEELLPPGKVEFVKIEVK